MEYKATVSKWLRVDLDLEEEFLVPKAEVDIHVRSVLFESRDDDPSLMKGWVEVHGYIVYSETMRGGGFGLVELDHLKELLGEEKFNQIKAEWEKL